jgi:hypothetical protein
MRLQQRQPQHQDDHDVVDRYRGNRVDKAAEERHIASPLRLSATHVLSQRPA